MCLVIPGQELQLLEKFVNLPQQDSNTRNSKNVSIPSSYLDNINIYKVSPLMDELCPASSQLCCNNCR